MAIILARRGRPVQKLERTIIQEENYLQRYLDDHPDMLPLDQLEADIRPLILVREFQTTSGSIDAIAVDQNANIYLIETKLFKNPDKRLVLAQVLDYGAALWKGYSDPDDLISDLDARIATRGGKSLSQQLLEFYGLEGEGATQYREGLKNVIASGSFRFVVLMDTIEERLRSLIAYVNANSAFDVLGVGLDFYQHDDIDILIPTLHGADAKKAVAASRKTKSRRWDKESFFEDAAARIAESVVDGLKSLFEWSTTNADNVRFGRGIDTGSFNPEFAVVCPRSVFTARSDGTLTLNFQWLTEPDSAREWRESFGELLRQSGFSIPRDFSEHYVALTHAEWVPKLTDFLRILGTEIANARKNSVTGQ